MKRLPFYIVLLALTFLAPIKRVDVGQLQPVEAVFLVRQGEAVTLTTDTGDTGQGSTALEALYDLKETTPAVIYLDTAEYLVLSESAAQDVQALRDYLKGSVRVCYMDGEVGPEKAVQYLNVHAKLPKLKRWKAGDELPILTNEKIIEKSENNA